MFSFAQKTRNQIERIAGERDRLMDDRVGELELEVRQKDREIKQGKQEIENLNQLVKQLSGEINHLNEQLNFERNIPKYVKEIFKNDKIPVFKRNENQPSELLNEFKNNKESKSMITQHLEDFMIKGKISIGCSDCLLWPDMLDYVSMICEVEKLVAEKVEKQVKKDYEDLSEWKDDPDTVKLTLIFNMFGLSPEIIEKFGPGVNGTDFNQDIFDLCSTYGIDDFATILDLGYIQMMLSRGNVPCRKHFESCPVCCCSTPKDLENLMKEHNLEFDFDLLERKNINERLKNESDFIEFECLFISLMILI